MATQLIIISHPRFSRRLARLFDIYGRITEIESIDLPPRFFDGQPITDIAEWQYAFELISRQLAQKPPECLRKLRVLLAMQLELASANNGSSRWNSLLDFEADREKAIPPELLASWLILAFPEVQWLFWGDELEDQQTFLHKCHSIHPISRLREFINNTHGLRNFLFDPSGLRNSIKSVIEQSFDTDSTEPAANSKGQRLFPRRDSLAVSIDEESTYAYINAYAAYRFGYRAWPITHYDQFCAILGSKESNIHLLFEDLYLFFPDRPLGHHLTDLRMRDEKHPGLNADSLRDRILVTVGHKRAGKWHDNNAYLRTLRRERGIRWKILYKPFSGIFDLWRKSGLWDKKRNKPAFGKGFKWPLEFSKSRLDRAGAHSTPGRLLMIAQHLLERSERVLRDASSVPDAIHAALLALEAKELIGCRTPTMALEAIALQHQSEIAAESMFYGIEYNLNVRDRFRDIEREVKAIASWFHPKSRARSQLNARLTIIESLARRFRELHQFEEEQSCLVEARKLRFAFWMRQSRWRYWTWPVLKYLQHALHSLPRFLLIVGIINLFFGAIYWGVSTELAFTGGWRAYLTALSASALFFFTLQPSPEWAVNGQWPNAWNLFLALQGVISFSNLTLLITNVYLIVSRR